jgi:hypothetical protein
MPNLALPRLRPGPVVGAQDGTICAVSDTVVLQSPLPPSECRERLKNHTVRAIPGVWIQATGFGGGPELHGKIGARRIRVVRPHATNTSRPQLVGTLDQAPDGSTILTARVRYTAGWPRLGDRNADDLDYLIDALSRISQFTKVGDST